MANSEDERGEVFRALVSNGFNFIERSAHELEKEPKFSISHFATGLELILKSRLFSEHWSLIGVTPHACAWTSVRDGTVRTIQASDLCSAISSLTGTSLNHAAPIFDRVFRHRNKVLHWIPDGSIEATAAEQCLAWYHLHGLLQGKWRHQFADFSETIEQVDRALRVYRTYLEVKFREIEPKLRQYMAEERLIECRACGFHAGVIPVPTHRVETFACEVCLNRDVVARVGCGRWVQLEDLHHLECECGDEHDRAELLEELDPTPLLGPKESLSYQPDRVYCGECLEPEICVARDGEDYVCVACGARFEHEQLSTCGWCSEGWAGYDTEHSYYLGCEFCDGHQPK